MERDQEFSGWQTALLNGIKKAQRDSEIICKAADDIDTLYNIVDVVFEKKSEEGLQKILSENVTNPQYEEIELYVKKKIKKQIIDAEYAFALRASFVLIDCNIDANYDDEEAFVLFTTISNETDD